MSNYETLIPKVLENVDLRNYTNTKTGGRTRFMFFPRNIEELIAVIKTLKKNHEKFEILGEMTNVAITEKNLNFLVINMLEFDKQLPIWTKNRFLKVSAGLKMKNLSVWAYQNNIKGLAWMEGIPGTIGAGIFMNAGFLIGQDIGTYLLEAEYLDLNDMKIKTISNQELMFRYRYSKFHDMNAIILGGVFLLQSIEHDWKYRLRRLHLKNKMHKYHNRRSSNQPLELPSAGTVFVPPLPWHVGGMIRELKLLEYTIGGAQISPKSPGFIVNIGGMTGEDYFALVTFIQEKVYNNYGIKLIPEVRLFDKEGISNKNV